MIDQCEHGTALIDACDACNDAQADVARCQECGAVGLADPPIGACAACGVISGPPYVRGQPICANATDGQECVVTTVMDWDALEGGEVCREVEIWWCATHRTTVG